MDLPQWIQDTRQTVTVPYPDRDRAETLAPAGAAPPTQKFHIECQRAFLWCWAAAAVSVTRFYDQTSTLQQCSLATRVLSAKNSVLMDCCVGSDRCMAGDRPRQCNAMGNTEEALCLVGHLQQRHDGSIPLSGGAGTVSIQDELDSGRPIVCRVKRDRSFAHIVVIYDYILDGEASRVIVADPADSRSIYATPSLETSFRGGLGKWTHTFTTRKREEEKNVDPES